MSKRYGEEFRSTDNPTVYNRIFRMRKLGCSRCKPNRGENKKWHKTYGTQKPKKRIRKKNNGSKKD